jgi:hypothetical protein
MYDHVMFEVLSGAVDGLDIPLEREALRALVAVRDRLDARLTKALAEYDAAGLYAVDGALSMQAWLRHQTDAASPVAARLVARGRIVQACPTLASAFVGGRLGSGHVDVIVACVPARHLERFAEVEAELVPLLEGLDVEQTRSAMLRWRAAADAVDDGGLPAEHDDEVHLSRTIGGRGDLRGSLGADLHAAVDAALRVADCGDRELTLAQRRADALGTVCRHFLDHQRVRPGGRHRPHISISVTHEQLAAGVGGTYVDTGAVVSDVEQRALLCDAAVHRLLVEGRGAILDYGRAVRAVPVDLYNALVLRDQGCRWPGCDRPASWTDAHHVWAWEHGGPTAIDNLVLLCRRHHRKAHSAEWHVKLLVDGTFETTGPDGRHQHSDPPAATGTGPPRGCARSRAAPRPGAATPGPRPARPRQLLPSPFP